MTRRYGDGYDVADYLPPRWDGNINSPHTIQDEYELARSLGVETLTTDDDGQMIAAEPAVPVKDRPTYHRDAKPGEAALR